MVEEALQALKDMVVAHYADSSEPLYLATVGQRLPAHRKQLVDKFRSLAGAVKHLGYDELGLITPSGKDSANGPAAVFSSLPTPIQIAFCLKTDPGETVAIRTTPPIRYLKLPEGEPAPAGFVVVEPKYRSAGLKLANASITDLERLGLSLNRWAADHQVDTDRLTQSATPANAFERFRVVQDPRVLPHIVLPADIVSILLRHS
jgi:hypothetical protein